MKNSKQYQPSNPHRKLPRSPKARKIPPPLGRLEYTRVYEVPYSGKEADFRQIAWMESHLTWPRSLRERANISITTLMCLHNEVKNMPGQYWPIKELEIVKEDSELDGLLKVTVFSPKSPARLGVKNQAFLKM